MERPSVPALQAFRRVAELHSFRAAGESLGLSGGAVSKLVAQLERTLRTRLLHRTTRTVRLSDGGAAFYEAAVRILDDLDSATDALQARAAAPSGRLRVSVPTSFALRCLAPRLPAFVEAHPQLELDLVLNDRYVDLVQEGFDCAIRIAERLPDSSLVARALGDVQRCLVAAPRYVEAAAPLERPADLDCHVCLAYSQAGGPVAWSFGRGAQATEVLVRPQCRVNNSLVLRDLLLAGLGLTLTPDFVVADLVADGRLVELLPAHRPPPLTVWGVVAHPRHVSHKVALFLDFVAQARPRR